MPKRNDRIPKNHFKKDWQSRVKTWFDQPAQKAIRKERRQQKAAQSFPRPTAGSVRPLVHPPTRRYNFKLKLGRGFSLEEVKAAGLTKGVARSLGVAVDHRRTNKSEGSFQANVQRLKNYRSKLVVLARNQKKVKAGEVSQADFEKVSQHTGASVLPVPRQSFSVTSVPKSSVDKKTSVHQRLRTELRNSQLVGLRQKVKAEKAAAAELTAKKA
eukprot:TRINITY_DN274_c0_g1_i1.p1 TRINITY_DN274_c0_g1~~TRINITY_DN274_c0_g1_i1.p1  ORF type:complete len:214 (-),score=56.46 TRINITY_DN274_c0_g1_i1:83-724(-)